jgi:hypothetical protein
MKQAFGGVPKIRPGDRGKAGSGWLIRPLRTEPLRDRRTGIIHQFLWRRSRAVSSAKRNLAVRDDEKPSRAGSSSAGWFRACANRSYPEGTRLLLCTSTERALKAEVIHASAGVKTPKGGTNQALNPEGTRDLGRIRENPSCAGDAEKPHRWPVSQRQPER